jgi:hypothetical protein
MAAAMAIGDASTERGEMWSSASHIAWSPSSSAVSTSSKPLAKPVASLIPSLRGNSWKTPNSIGPSCIGLSSASVVAAAALRHVHRSIPRIPSAKR